MFHAIVAVLACPWRAARFHGVALGSCYSINKEMSPLQDRRLLSSKTRAGGLEDELRAPRRWWWISGRGWGVQKHLGENGVLVHPETVRVRGWRGEVGARRER